MDLVWLISVLLLGAALGFYISTLRQTRQIFALSKSVAINAGSSGNKKTKSKEPLEIEKLADLRKNFKMVLVVRNDLKMGKGKIAAQCSHATLGLYKKLLQRAPKALNRWEYCAQPKVVVKIESEEEMLVLQERAKSLKLPTHITIDAGKTQIAPNSRTVMAILGTTISACNMKLDFTPIAQLESVTENEIWKIKARVARFWRFHNNDKPGDSGGLDLLLVDDKGDRIQACIRGKLIQKFEKDLQEGECCILMNFKLSPNLGSYRATGHSFKIFFTWSTIVKPCEEIPNHSLRFSFIPFDKLQRHDENVFLDVIGEIVGMKDLKEITVRNAPCKLLNLQLKSLDDSIIDCVFWEKFAEDIHSYVQSFSGGPIVMLCSLMRINVYNGKFTIQSAKSSTKLFINSDIAEINEFKERMPKDVVSATSSGCSILTLSNSKEVSSHHFSLDSRKTIAELLTSHEEMTCSIYATICALKTEIPWFYIGCPTCFRKVNQYLNPDTEEIEADKFSCDLCQKVVDSTVTRYQVHVKVVDDTGTISFLMFDKEVIQLIHKSAYELLEQQVQFNRGTQFPPELLALDGRQFVFTVFKPSTTKNYRPATYKVVKITDDPAKLLMFCGANNNTANPPAIDSQFSNSTEVTSNMIDDASFEASNNESMCGSTESPLTPSKKRTFTSAIMSSATEDGGAQLSSKIQKPNVVVITEEDAGQLSSTKPKLRSTMGVIEDDGANLASTKPKEKSNKAVIEDDGANLSSTKHIQKMPATLIPKKEKM